MSFSRKLKVELINKDLCKYFDAVMNQADWPKVKREIEQLLFSRMRACRSNEIDSGEITIMELSKGPYEILLHKMPEMLKELHSKALKP